MEEEHPVDKASEEQIPEEHPAPASIEETVDKAPEETIVAAVNAKGSEDTGAAPDDPAMSTSGTFEKTSEFEDASEQPARPSTLLYVGIAAVFLLIIAALLLPPVSLPERLGLVSGGDVEGVAESGLEEAAVDSDLTLRLEDADADVRVEQISRSGFLAQSEGDDWSGAAAAVPARVTLASDVYTFRYGDSAPSGTVEIPVPADAQPYQTLDLFAWDGAGWYFVPSSVSQDGTSLTSARGALPLALALMQTSAPENPEIGAEVLPSQSLPVEVLPHITEVAAGTLTLAQDGTLLGEVMPVPTGGYRQFLRATNTGALVDTVSIEELLKSQAAQEQNIQALVDLASSGEFAGVNLDYQGVPVEQKEAFSRFVSSLADALHQQALLLIVTLEAPVQLDDSWDTAGQDWAAIGQVADVVYAQMSLDPTVYADSGAAEQMLVWATRNVDRSKVTMLDTANAVDGVGDAIREVAHGQALENFGVLELDSPSAEVEPGEDVTVALSGSASDLEWDPASLTYKYTYEQGGQPHTVWLTNEAVLGYHARLAARYNLRGIAVRGLGTLSKGEGYAEAIRSYLGASSAPQPASASILWAVEDESGALIASSSSETLAFNWQAAEAPGTYTIRADFSQGDSVASLGAIQVSVAEPATPTPSPEPTEETVAEAAPTTEAGSTTPLANADPGSADAAANTDVNVRSGPGLNYGIIGGLRRGETVSLIGRSSDSTWLQVVMQDGTEGWVFALLMTVNPSIAVASLDIVEVEPPVASSGGSGAPPPVIAPAGGGSFELGGQTHTLANPTLMNMAGMNWVKFQHKWGPGDTPDAVAGRIQQGHANGFKVLLSIPGANAYPSSIDFNTYVEFLRGVAALGPDAIEVWNEENIDFEWPAGQIDPTSYVNNMLAPAYNAIKSANSSVMVISGAPAPTGFDNGTNAWSDSRYMAGVAAAGGASYMDCIGVHHNAGATSPNATSGHPTGSAHYSWYFFPTLNMYYNAFGGARPVCFTELGYLSGEDFGGVPSRFSWAADTSVAEHAQWLAEAASLSANSGRVRLMIVFNVDFTLYGDDPQAGYAMLRPNGSCPSCTLLGQVMGS